MMTTTTVTAMTGEQWKAANFRFLEAEMERLRLLLHRRVLWLRKHWRHDSPQNYLGWVISDREADLLLSEKDRQEELNFYQVEPEAQQIGERLEQSSRELSARRQGLAESGNPAVIDLLAARFDLSAFERDLVLLCLDRKSVV